MTLSKDSADRINLLYRAAKHNGSLVSVQELTRLLREGASESDVETAIASDPSLNSRFELRSGFLTERNADPMADPILQEVVHRKTASVNLSHASKFASFLRYTRFSLVAVSGSTSYGSASFSRDADLFCVTPAGGTWVSLAAGLIMARAYSLANREAPAFCLSCVMDEDYARTTFHSQRHPLFARDAVEAKVLMGQGLYRALMREASWIAGYYPVAYNSATTTPGGATRRSSSGFVRALNKLLYATLGRYIRAKSYLLNRRLRANGRSGDVFKVRLGEDHLIYESRRYLDLRMEYGMAETTQPPLTALVAS
jgi:hypothetical protein